MERVVIVGHGSRSKEAREDFNKIISMVEEMVIPRKVNGAHMELCSPSIEECIKEIIETEPKIKTIKIVPYFLYSGIHIKEDIPEIIEKIKASYPHIEFKLGRALGAEVEIARILKNRIEEL